MRDPIERYGVSLKVSMKSGLRDRNNLGEE